VCELVAMTRDHMTGNLIGSSFGLAFILANLGALPETLAWIIRVLAIIAALGLFVRLFRQHPAGAGAAEPSGDRESRAAMFGVAYWVVVAAEVVVGLLGLLLFNNVLDWPVANVPWIVLVVGVHFVLLARVWHEQSIQTLGVALSVLGVVGFVLAALDISVSGVRLVAGVGAGVIILGGAWWAALQSTTDASRA
jgi:hypothetical protein